MFIKLNPTLKAALNEAKEIANENGYFSVEGDGKSRHILDELKRLGYVRQVSDWTGFDFAPTHFVLESMAYFYDENEAEAKQESERRISMFRKLPSNSRNLLQEIVSSGNPVSLLCERFESCSHKEDDELRSLLRELIEEKYINIHWASDLPYIVDINNSARTYAEREAEYERQLAMSGSYTTIVHGSVDRINNNSIDNSVNIKISAEVDELFERIFATVRENGLESDVKIETAINEMKQTVGKPTFTEKYNAFMQSAANHMTVFAPFLPQLSQLLCMR